MPRGTSLSSGSYTHRYPVYRLAGRLAGASFPSCPFSDRTRSCRRYGGEASPEGLSPHLTVVWCVLWVIASVLETRRFLGAIFGSRGESMEGLVVQNNTEVRVNVLFLVADTLEVFLA